VRIELRKCQKVAFGSSMRVLGRRGRLKKYCCDRAVGVPASATQSRTPATTSCFISISRALTRIFGRSQRRYPSQLDLGASLTVVRVLRQRSGSLRHFENILNLWELFWPEPYHVQVNVVHARSRSTQLIPLAIRLPSDQEFL
jgi:hypothetical protein